MSIRTRVTLWYAGMLLFGLALIAACTYYEMFIEFRQPATREVLAAHGETELEEFGEIFLYGGLPALLIAVIGGGFVIRRALKPITALTQAVEKLHADNLCQQLPRPQRNDELGRLTDGFNHMTVRLNDSFQRVREFTLHASHELKTPLTVMRGELESALHDDALDPASRERLASLLDEVQRLAQIVDSLTLLTKADAGMLKLSRNPLRLDELVREAHADAQILAAPRRIQVQLEHCPPVIVTGDRHRLRQLLLILTDNAIKYNVDHGLVAIRLEFANWKTTLAVKNSGPGIPAAIRERVFDRFFRGDPSHSQEVEGCGLGLSIARCIAEAHDGTIKLVSEPSGLTVLTVELPAMLPEDEPSREICAESLPTVGVGASH